MERHFEILKFDGRAYKWLEATTLTAHLIPGTVNPSNECYLTNWYTGDTFRASEFEAIFNTLKKMLLN